MKGFTTKAVHGQPFRTDVHGSLRTPVYDNAAFEVGTSEDLELTFLGRKAAHAYSRITNPTVEEFEQKVRLLTGAFSVIAVSSGMAAIANSLIAIAEAGTNIVTSPFLFGNTRSLFDSTLKRWGLSTRFVDMTNTDALSAALDSQTRAIFLEIVTNPQLEVADIAAISNLASQKGVPIILDGTLTTPYLFRSKDAGVAVEIISSTKYISGGATSIGGLIIDNGVFDWRKNPALAEDARKVGPGALIMRLRREVYRNLGACLSPHNAWLQSLGLETLALRVNRSCSNAMAIADFLDAHSRVKSVNYPGLPSSPSHERAHRQFGGRFGGLLTFELSDKGACFRFMNRLKILRRATNVNDNKSLIIHPASTIFADYTAEQRLTMGVTDSLIRFSAGIEDTEDLIHDFRQGLDAL